MQPETPSLRSTLLPPIGTGLAYAGAKAIALGPAWGGLYWQSPIIFSFLSGLLIAVALRPILARVPWQRGAAFALVLMLMLALGPAAGWTEARLIAALDVMGFPYALSRDIWPELFGAWAAGGVLAWIHRLRGGEIGLANLWVRVRRRPAGPLLLRLTALGGAVVLISIALGMADGHLVRATAMQPLFPVNPWLRAAIRGAESAQNATMLSWGGAGLGAGDALILLSVSWIKGLALALALLPIALVVRGTRAQMSLVFSILPFVIGEFAPLMENQPFPSQSWLAARVALALVACMGIGVAAAWLIGQEPQTATGATAG